MSHPKAYDPQQGYRYQLFCRYCGGAQSLWEHCDYAKDKAELVYLTKEYSLAYGIGWEFKAIRLPRKYTNEREFPSADATRTSVG